MNWGSLDNFLAMGGYGGFVWGSYAAVVLVLVVEIVLVRRRLKAAQAAAARAAEAGTERD